MFLPITDRGRTSSTLRSAAARVASASSEISIPGASAPPRNSPLAETTSMLVEVPKSTTTQAVLVQPVRGEGVHHPVAADLPRVVDQQRDPGAHARADHHRRLGPPLGEQPQLAQQAGHGGQRGDAGDLRAYRPSSAATDTSSSSAVIRGSVRIRQSRISSGRGSAAAAASVASG